MNLKQLRKDLDEQEKRFMKLSARVCPNCGMPYLDLDYSNAMWNTFFLRSMLMGMTEKEAEKAMGIHKIEERSNNNVKTM